MLSKVKFIVRGILGFFENFEDFPRVNLKGEVLGKSVRDKEILFFALGDGKKKILILGGVHGNEVGTSKLVLNLLNLTKIDSKLYCGKTLYFIPTLNIDGLKCALKSPDYFNGGAIGRTNTNDVDLNRNFDTKNWQKDGIWEFGNKKIKVSGGNKAMSESEVKALADFVNKNKIEVIFDFHNRAGSVLATSSELGKKIANKYSEISGYRNITGSSWQNTGWIKEYFEAKGITYVEIETTKRWGSDFRRNKQAFKEVLKLI